MLRQQSTGTSFATVQQDLLGTGKICIFPVSLDNEIDFVYLMRPLGSVRDTYGVHSMQHSWRHRAVLTVFFLAGLSVTPPVSASPPIKERLPLTLSGSGCSGNEAEVAKVLQGIPGVSSVNFTLVPGHVLVDFSPGIVKSNDVITRVNEAASSWQCKVEFIEGCISASMPTASSAPHQHE